MKTFEMIDIQTSNIELGRSQRSIAIHCFGEQGASPLLCLSGLGWNSDLYTMLAPFLKNRRVIVIDNRGMGESESVDRAYSIADLATDIIEIADILGIQNYHLMGISMGGFIAQELALKDSQRLLSLALLCTSSAGDKFIPLPNLTPEMLEQSYQIPRDKRSELSVRGTVHPELELRDRERFYQIVSLREGSWPKLEQLLWQKRAADDFLKSDELALSEIKCPVLILSGANDRFVDPENSNRLATQMSGASSVKIEFINDSDHLFFMERPEQVSRELNLFLSAVESTRGDYVNRS